MNEPGNDWVTIATFSSLQEAQVQRGFLEHQGIEAFIPEEFTVSIFPVAPAVQVRVQVRERDVAQARQLLAEIAKT